MSKKSDAVKIIEIANRLGTQPEWLDALINFETAGTYSPSVKNPASSARGLIQVIDSTARSEFNVPDSLALTRKYPTFDSQMDNVVYPYLKKYAPYRTKQELYMAVFYPAYRKVSPDKRFPQRVINANTGRDNKGRIVWQIRTPQDYINFVDRRIRARTLRLPFSASISLAVPIVLIGTGVIWYYLRSRKKR